MSKTSNKGGSLTWKASVPIKASLPLTGNTIDDARIVTDDGGGVPTIYICIATSGLVDTQWVKLTASPAVVYWRNPVATKAALPLIGNTIGDAITVKDDGDGNPAIYLCIATAGLVDVQWVKVADVDWGDIFDAGVVDGDILKKNGDKLAKVTAIPESLIVANQAIASFSHDAGVQEKGVALAGFHLAWTFNRNGDDPSSQSITPIVDWTNPIANNLRALTVDATMTPLTTTTTYTFSGVGDDSTVLAGSTTIYFRSKRYWGVSGSILTTDAEVLANLAGSEFGTSKGVTKTFDASAGSQYLYFCYPTAWGAPSGTLFGGFEFSDYTQTTISNFTNASGHSEDYYLLRTNGTYNGASLSWAIY